MTPQAIVGLVFVLIGIAIKVLQLAGLLGAGELGMVGEVSNLGFALLGKELWPGSPQSFAAKSRSVPPIAIVLLALLALPACATLRDIKPIARDVNDVARELCETSMGAEAERQGISVRDLCAINYVIRPFFEAPNLASANAVLGRVLDSAPRCTP